jgi:RNA polymerase sigma-70 factor, ECF subfamily
VLVAGRDQGVRVVEFKEFKASHALEFNDSDPLILPLHGNQAKLPATSTSYQLRRSCSQLPAIPDRNVSWHWPHLDSVTHRGFLSDLTDTALISRFLGGDEGAFRELYARHTPRLRMIVVRLLGAARRADVDDVVQETWLAGCRGIHRYAGDAKFSSWLTTIGIRTAYSRFGRSTDAETDLYDELPAPSGSGPATAIDLERALSQLPDHQRVVVVLHDVEGFTHQEIARQLGIASGTAKATLSRARSTLRRLLNDGVSHVG